MKVIFVVLVGFLMFSGPLVALAQAPDTVKVGIIPIADMLPYFAANEKGFFTENRIKADSTSMAGGAVIIPAIIGRELHVGLSATVSAIQARARGLEIVAVAPATTVRPSPPGSNAILVRKDSGINGPKDLAGKNFAVNVINSIVYMIGAEYVSRGGVDPAKVQWLEIPFPQMPPALLTRKVDALDTVEPFVSILLNSGEAKVLAWDADIMPGLSMAVFVADERWVKRSPEVVARFVRGLKKGIDYVNANPDYVRTALKKDLKLDPKLADQIVLHVYRPNIDEKEIIPLIDTMRKYRLLDRPIDVKSLIYETAR